MRPGDGARPEPPSRLMAPGIERSCCMTIVGIGIAGAAGTLVRYWLDGAISRRMGGFPWGTFVVNVTGAFLVGLVFTALAERTTVEPWVRSSLTIGFLGAYTTFSTL